MGALGGLGGLGGVRLSPPQTSGANIFVSELFTDEDAVSLAEHTILPIDQSAAGWVIASGAATIDTNAAKLAAGTPDIVVLDVGVTDHIITVDVTQGNRNRLGIIFRYVDNNVYGFFEASGDDNEAQLRYNNTGFTTVDQDDFAWTGTQEVKIISIGTSISCKVDDVEICAGTVSVAAAGTKIGFWGWTAGTATFDNLIIRQLATADS